MPITQTPSAVDAALERVATARRDRDACIERRSGLLQEMENWDDKILRQQLAIMKRKKRLQLVQLQRSPEAYLRLFLDRAPELTPEAIRNDAQNHMAFQRLLKRLHQLLKRLYAEPLDQLEALAPDIERINAAENALLACAEQIRATATIADDRERKARRAYWLQLLEADMRRFLTPPAATP